MSYIVSEIRPALSDCMRSNVCRDSRKKIYTAAIAAADKQIAEDAFRVRYASYLDNGFINPNPDRMFRDEFDNLPNSTTIVVYDGERAVASVRVCLMSHAIREAPAHHAFPQEVDSILENVDNARNGFAVAEITRLVRSPDCANNQGLVFLLYRLAGYLGLREDVQTILSSVRSNHVPFYRRLGFGVVAGPMPYPGLKCPMHLMRCRRTDYDMRRSAFPMMDPDATPPGTFDGFIAGRAIAMKLAA